MTRKLRPCGTLSAYRRHLNRKETPCDACREANNARFPAGAVKVIEAEMADALEADPPVIEWAKNKHGVWVWVSINDPHAEREQPRVRERECTDPELLAAGTREI